eukprot:COSAG02_NODE_963_length_15604_cov_10.737117_7_plen_98_part_00
MTGVSSTIITIFASPCIDTDLPRCRAPGSRFFATTQGPNFMPNFSTFHEGARPRQGLGLRRRRWWCVAGQQIRCAAEDPWPRVRLCDATWTKSRLRG